MTTISPGFTPWLTTAQNIEFGLKMTGVSRSDRRHRVEEALRMVHLSRSGDKLVQVFTDENQHSYLADAQYPAMFTALLQWIERGDKPTPQKVLDLCKGYEAGFGGTCRIQPAYQPPPYDSRVAPRP